MTQPVDGVYDHTKPWRAPVQPDQVAKRWQYNGPWSTNAERLVSQALMIMNIPGKDIQAMVRPPLPQIRLFPDRFGYGARIEPTIELFLVVVRFYKSSYPPWIGTKVTT